MINSQLPVPMIPWPYFPAWPGAISPTSSTSPQPAGPLPEANLGWSDGYRTLADGWFRVV